MTGTIDLKFPVLIGDIGGTNARFQIIERANAASIAFETVQTANFDTMEQAIEHSVLNQTDIKPRCALIAAAGLPVATPVIAADDWMQAMGMDKKVQQKRLRFILLKNLGDAYVTDAYDAELLGQILDRRP